MAESRNKKYLCITGKAEEAIYSEPVLAFDRDNLCIAALPPECSEHEMKAHHYKPFPMKPSINAEPRIQENEIELLNMIRVPLGYSVRLENDISKGLVNTYRNRRNDLALRPVEVTIEDKTDSQDYTMKTPLKGDDSSGIALLGIGGTGKTEALTMLLAHYPQHIIHHVDNNTFHQIVWIKIEPSGNNDLATLFDNFGAAMDEALGNITPVYAKLMRSKKKLGEKANFIASLIRTFCVGMVIIDEFQRLELARNRSESFESLMTFINTTKALLVVAGTEDAYELIFSKYYTARRLSNQIYVSTYCEDREIFDGTMSLIMGINWFKTEQNIERKELLDFLYEETEGQIDGMIIVWKEVQKKYVRLSDDEKKNFVLTEEFIMHASRSYNNLRHQMTKDAFKNDFAIRARNSIREAKNLNPPVIETTVSQERALEPATMKSILLYKERLKSLERGTDAVKVYERVKINIEESGDEYSDETIVSTVEQVFKARKSKNMAYKDLLSSVLRKLRNKPEEKKPKIKVGTKTNIDLTTFDAAMLDA